MDAFTSAQIVSNLEAIGIVDRDFRSSDQLAALAQTVSVLPVHEIEGIVCLPAIGDRLAVHSATTVENGIEAVIRDSITDAGVCRVAYERTKMRLRNALEDDASVKPNAWDAGSLESHFTGVHASLSTALDATSIWTEELTSAETVRSSGDVEEILALFPSKAIASKVAMALGASVSKLFELLTGALGAAPNDPLHALGHDLEAALGTYGLPPRSVGERPGASEVSTS